MKRNGIFSQMLLSTIVPAVLVFVMVVAVINDIMIEQNTNNMLDNAGNQAAYLANLMTETYNDYQTYLSFIAMQIGDELDGTHCSKPARIQEDIEHILADSVEAMSHIYCAWLVIDGEYGRYSRLMYSSDEDKAGLIDTYSDELLDSPNDAAWYHTPMQTGQPFFDPTVMMNYGNGWVTNCTVAMPIEYNGKTSGVLGFDVKYDHMFNAAEINDADHSPYGMIVDNGYIFYSSNSQIIRENVIDAYSLSEKEAVELSTNIFYKNSGFVSGVCPFTGKSTQLYLQPLSLDFTNRAIYLFSDQPKDVLTAASSDAVKSIILTSLIGLVVIAVSIFASTRRIVLPIQQLISTADSIAKGKGEIAFFEELEIGTKAHNELYQLNAALRHMMDQLTQTNLLRMQKIEAEFERERAIADSNARTQFFANMSHEIRTPMNSILGIVQIMLMSDDLNPKQEKYLSDIKISAESLLGIINDILDLAKLEQGRINLHDTHFNFVHMIENICTIFRMSADQKNIEFITENHGEQLPVCLYGDELRVRQVIVNLVSNAVKYTDKGQVHFIITVTDDELIFEVKDTGIGIKETDMEKIFMPYERTNGSVLREGSGLGLSITKSLLDTMDGTIEVQSVWGEGSTFTVHLPKHLGDIEKMHDDGYEELETEEFSGNIKVLIVDDNEINLQVASGLIEIMFDATCDLALSGQEALTFVKAQRYDLIFMDHMMPEMDGVEATKQIRALGGYNTDVPIIALTANAVIGAQSFFFEAGMNDFLAKPINRKELTAVVNKWAPKCTHTKDTNRPTVKKHTDIITAAGKIPGLDINVGLANVSGDQQAYEKLLSILKEKLHNYEDELPRYFSEGKYDAFTIQIHAIKSSMASLGADELSKIAARMEASAHDGDFDACREALPKLMSKLGSMSKQLDLIFDRWSNTAVDKSVSNDFSVHMAEAKAMFEDYDFDGLTKKIEQMQSLNYGAEKNKVVSQLKTAVSCYDYDKMEQLFASEK